ncbi:MAG: ADP-glyceromanno-heptose 6-epimerase [Chitinophagaceae bacterium]
MDNKAAISNSQSSIIVTGAAGFIGSCMVEYLNEHGFENLILVDKFTSGEKEKNWKEKKYQFLVDRELLFEWLDENKPAVDFFVHLGARTNTTEFDYQIFEELNVEYSQDVWNYCTINNVPLIYASSAATYGAGELGYNDTNEIIEKLQPLNPYGISKNEFDKWALQQKNHPPFWAGLKFFNVYGPNEYHKARMASVIFHAFNQIQKNGAVKLFKSHKPEYKDGEQLRDFIYVKDVIEVIFWMMNEVNGEPSTADHRLSSGIYNLGTGKSRTFNDLVKATFAAFNMQPNIIYIDMPEDIRDKYQYFTEANMKKLQGAGYNKPFQSLENGVNDYVRNYLSKQKYY